MKKYLEYIFIVFGAVITFLFFIYLFFAMIYTANKHKEEKNECLQFKNNLVKEIPAYCLKHFNNF